MLTVYERLEICSETLDYWEDRMKSLLEKVVSKKNKNQNKIQKEFQEIRNRLDYESKIVDQLQIELDETE